MQVKQKDKSVILPFAGTTDLRLESGVKLYRIGGKSRQQNARGLRESGESFGFMSDVLVLYL